MKKEDSPIENHWNHCRAVLNGITSDGRKEAEDGDKRFMLFNIRANTSVPRFPALLRNRIARERAIDKSIMYCMEKCSDVELAVVVLGLWVEFIFLFNNTNHTI